MACSVAGWRPILCHLLGTGKPMLVGQGKTHASSASSQGQRLEDTLFVHQVIQGEDYIVLKQLCVGRADDVVQATQGGKQSLRGRQRTEQRSLRGRTRMSVPTEAGAPVHAACSWDCLFVAVNAVSHTEHQPKHQPQCLTERVVVVHWRSRSRPKATHSQCSLSTRRQAKCLL